MGRIQVTILGVACWSVSTCLWSGDAQLAMAKRFEAMRLYEDKRWSEALEAIGWAVDHGSDDAMNYYWRARIRMDEEGQFADLGHALHLNPDLTQAYLLRAELFSRKNEWDKAKLDYDQVIAKQPLIEAYWGRAQVNVALKRWPDAVSDLDLAVSLDDYHWDALRLRAQVLVQLKRHQDAVNDYRSYLQQHPEDTLAWQQLGALLLETEQYPQSLWALQNALRLSPEDRSVQQNTGLAYFFIGQYDEAEKLFRHLIESDAHDADAYNHLGTVLLQRGMVKQARAMYDLAIDEGLDEPGVFYNRARAAFEELDMLVAAQDLERALAHDPHMYRAHLLLAEVYRTQKDWGRAIRHYQIYLKNADNKNTNAWYALAACWMHLDNYEQAVVAWTQLVTLNPGFRDAYFQRARAYSQLEAFDEAEQDYYFILSLDPKNAESYYNLANIAYKRGYLDQAIQLYSQALKYNPGWKDAYYNRALAKQSLGDNKGSQHDFQLSQTL